MVGREQLLRKTGEPIQSSTCGTEKKKACWQPVHKLSIMSLCATSTLTSPAAEMTTFLRALTLRLTVPIIQGPTAEVNAMGFTVFFFNPSKLEARRKWIQTPTHGMSYRFDFDLSSNCRLKKKKIVSNMSCGLAEIALEGRTGVDVTGNLVRLGFFFLILHYLLITFVHHPRCFPNKTKKTW